MQGTKSSSTIDNICKTSGQDDADLRAVEEGKEILQLGCEQVILFCSGKHVFTVRNSINEICDSQLASGG